MPSTHRQSELPSYSVLVEGDVGYIVLLAARVDVSCPRSVYPVSTSLEVRAVVTREAAEDSPGALQLQRSMTALKSTKRREVQ